ncbi:MAG: helix-turn-helix domain-containing protein [Prevotella sp.]|nr:helix-turn-helix domain-containing protein [Prevotella sp.]
MYKQPGQEEFLFYVLYTGAAMLSLIACCYLLFRRANAIVPDITPPTRLRRWTAVLFGAMTLSHVWYMPGVFLTSANDIMLHDLVGGLLDSMTFIPLSIVVMLCMLQDRRRSLWPAWVMASPLVVGMALCIAKQSYDPLPMVLGYLLLLGIGFVIYMVRAIRQYDRWLHDNYADLEHKEVWQSFVVLAAILLMTGVYAFGFEWPAYDLVVQVNNIVLICYLLWRVETLSDLSISQSPFVNEETVAREEVADDALSQTIHNDIGPKLMRYCEEPQLYLQHDLTLSQLTKAIGTNRTYLGQYFSSRGITYNAYINELRISYFVSLYREAVADMRPFTAQQLAYESGYRSYSTFRNAFKHVMGQSVSIWMKDQH